jgi:hypothetical protein
MAGGERVGLEFAHGVEQFAELDLLIANHAGDWRLARRIAVRERLHDGRLEALLVVEDVVGDAEPVGDAARIVDVLAGAAGSTASDSLTMIIELQGDANDVEALLLEQRRNDG